MPRLRRKPDTTPTLKPTWKSKDGTVQLFHADCMDVLADIPDKSIDALVVDPNYGIGEAAGKNKSRTNMAIAKDYGIAEWDDEPCQPETLAEMRRVARWQIIFGGNYFDLPPTPCVLVWDKMNGRNDFADCELAWTNLRKAVRRIQFRWNGMIRDEKGERVHPTQKPARVMEWCIEHLPADVETIIDTHMGSGTTGVAARRKGKRFIGIERERHHFESAKARLSAEEPHIRHPLFEQPKQKAMF